MKASKLLVCVLAASAIAACATVRLGSEFDLQAFEKNVQRGVTTREQVQAWLGAPTSRGVAVEISGETLESWSYYFGEGQLASMSGARFKTLQVKFDSTGVVRAYIWSSNQ